MALKYNSCTGSLANKPVSQEQKPTESVFPKFSPDIWSHVTETYKTVSCCNTVVLPQWHLISRVHNVCELCVNQTAGMKPSKVSVPPCNFLEIEAALDSFYLKEQLFMGFMSNVRECSNFLSFYSPFNHYTACCRTVSRGLMTSMTNLENMHFAFASHGKNYKENSQHFVPHIEEKILVNPSSHIDSSNITGLRCRTNKTLNLYLLDSNLSWIYAERLGASGSAPGKRFAAIIDLKEELHYILDQPLIRTTLEAFIQNFSKLYSPLQRHLVSNAPPRVSKQHLITEVTSSTFYRLVLESKKDVLLLYYTTWCGFCAALNHIFIRLTQLLATDSLVVARINIAHNDLPWEFMVDRVPTILFFPKSRKDQSVKYPEDQKITLPNLLKFIVKHATLPSPAANPPASCPKDYLHYKEVHVSYLEREIRRLRAEIEVLHKAQDQLASLMANARKDGMNLKVQKQRLEDHNKALEIHKWHLQALYEEKAKEVGTMADKLKELADASESLLAENALLKFLLPALEPKSTTTTETDRVNNIDDGIRPMLDSADVSEGISDTSTMGESTVTLEHSKGNETD
ncbi:thioredoxin domain-containing protein 11 isoform X3 [Ascaphus truei]